MNGRAFGPTAKPQGRGALLEAEYWAATVPTEWFSTPPGHEMLFTHGNVAHWGLGTEKESRDPKQTKTE